MENFFSALAELYRRAGAPPYRRLIKHGKDQRPPVVFSDATLSDWIAGKTVPASARPFRVLVEGLQAMADRRRNPDYRAQELAWWEVLRRRAADERRGRQGGRRAAVVDMPPAAASAAEAPGQPLADVTDPFQLEVHPAIDASPPGSEPLPLLPLYVERQHDMVLGRVVRAAAEGASGLAMLVGSSSSGKTRACWEALSLLPDGWRLWHPADAEAALDRLDAVVPRTVIWLDETHNSYLRVREGRVGERLCNRLRTLLHDPTRAPVLLLGTMWEEVWDRLTTQPAAGADDLHPRARTLLTSHGIPTPAAFTSDEDQARLTEAAGADPRLGQALAKAGQQITQYLAGVPVLMERYQVAPDGARALVRAAVDARRFGHGRDIPLPVLRAAAPAYLTEIQWNRLAGQEDWLAGALSFTDADCRGVGGILTRVHLRPGEPQHTYPLYRLADYLEQHGRANATAAPVPAEFWEALLEHADPSELVRIALAVREMGLSRLAVLLGSEAARKGITDAYLVVAEVLIVTGRIEESLAWYERAVQAGDREALHSAASFLKQADRLPQAMAWYERAASAGDRESLFSMAATLVGLGRLEEALDWCERAAEQNAGDLLWVADTLADHGYLDEALPWYERAVDAGETSALIWAADSLAAAGRLDMALTRYEKAAETGHSGALARGGNVLVAHGRLDEALTWYERAVDAGDNSVLLSAAEALAARDRVNEALDWYERARRAGRDRAPVAAAKLLADLGRWEEALVWCERAVAAGSSSEPIADILVRAGRASEARKWCEQAAHAGRPRSLGTAIWLLMRVGFVEEALVWCERAAGASPPETLTRVGDLLSEVGLTAEALQWYERAVQAGDIEAPRCAGRMLAEMGCLDEALTWYERGIQSGDTEARHRAVQALVHAGRVDEAVIRLARGALVGEHGAFTSALFMLESAGRSAEAESLRRSGWEADGTTSREWSAPPLPQPAEASAGYRRDRALP
ncbi:tetratricopeptide repeat protein [Streptomyces sp. NBC_01294]|uniref:tetratricopeptide repeat protein n=1 Tax=Streptomyces sp. NBC_01294 TaxID=2903815 RepID=UPI002DDAE29F|nr:tetratricopeptide repeat protein [Streptomyces sp. NBC_01294]WRZ56311.1 tetratricopeptide repeat protein [Streptomyces sp. NBC_01294]